MKKQENYLEKIPVRSEKITWSEDEQGIVTLKIENKGLMKRITQKLLKKPKYSYVHLDENGSFVWKQIDGEKTIIEIGSYVKEHFGDKAEPLYERLAKFFKALENCRFTEWKN